MKIKRLTALLLAMIMIFSFAGCKSKTDTDTSSGITTGDTVQAGTEDNADTNSEATNDGANTTPSTTTPAGTTGGLAEIGVDADAAAYSISGSIDSVENRVNLKGKKIKMAVFSTINYTSSKFQRMVRSFEDKYGCTVEISKFAFGSEYQNAIKNAVAANSPYDIAFMHGSWFYDAIASNVYQPLNSSISAKDLLDSNKNGLDLTKSAECSWNYNLYGVCGYEAVNPMLIYYNKKKFRDAGLEDPRTLYNEGKWTWSKFIEMGLAVTDSSNNVWFGEYNFFRAEVIATYGGSPVTFVDGVPTVSISSNAYINGLKLIQTLGYGTNKVIKTQSAEDQLQNFYDGVTYVYTEESDRYTRIMENIGGLNAFEGTADNLGIVPFPLGGSNKKYPTGWIEVACSPKGSDPALAVLWAKHQANFVDPITSDVTVLQGEDAKLVEGLLGNILPRRCGYSDSSNSMSALEWDLCTDTANKGIDISTSIQKFSPLMKSCIDATLSNLAKIK